jgi:hypothetical protein
MTLPLASCAGVVAPQAKVAEFLARFKPVDFNR